MRGAAEGVTAHSPPPLHSRSYTNFTYAAVISGAVSPTSNAVVHVTITNAGYTPGSDVAQLYVAGLPGDPPRGLKAFAATPVIPAGGHANVTLTLTARDLATWSSASRAFVTYPGGEYAWGLGASSCDVRVTGVVRVEAAYSSQRSPWRSRSVRRDRGVRARA